MGAIQRTFDAICLTQLDLGPEKDTLLNKAANRALSPLQYALGKNKYESLNGRVSTVPSEITSPETLLIFVKLKKVFVVAIAILPALIGSITRGVSLYVSSDVAEAYNFVRFVKLPESEFNVLEPQLPPDLVQRVRAARAVYYSPQNPPSAMGKSPLSGPPTSPSAPPVNGPLVDDEPSAPTHPAAPIEPKVEPRKDSSLGNDERAAPTLSPAPIVESIEPPVETKIDIRPLLVSFFKNLDEEIQKHPTDAAKIEVWLQSQVSRPDYRYYFFCAPQILYDLYVEDVPNHEEIHSIYHRCIKGLKALELQRYTEEIPSSEFRAQMKEAIDEQKDELQEKCQASLFVLRPLSEMLKQLPAEAKEAQCQMIEAWFTQFKAHHLIYNNPFFLAPSLVFIRHFLTDILSEEELRELVQLHESCRKKLRELKLDEYIEERPADLTPEQRKLRNQLINEIWFFRALCSQKDRATLVAWLQENSPKADYPLLWGQQRSLHLENYSDGIDPIILRAWKHDFSESQTRLCAYHLQSFLHADEIPADASPELLSFLVSDLCNEIQAAIKNPTTASSVVLTQHLRFYLTKYASTVQRLVPSELLSQWKEAFIAVPEETPPLPAAEALKATTQFYRDLSTKYTKEGNESAQHWLDAQKTDENYAFPFYYSLYWQTLVNIEDNLTLKILSASHKKIVLWAYLNNQGAQLFETPPALSPGLCQLVHRLTEDLVLLEIPEDPVPVKTPAPKPLHPFLVHDVDDEAFKNVISELAPHMAPLFQKPEMLLYWKNTLLDCAVFFCLDTMAIYQETRAKTSKKEILAYFTTLKSRPGCEDKVTLFSKDYVSIVKQLAPLLPKDLAKQWNHKYAKFCEFLRQNGIQDDNYINVKASPFFARSALTFKEQFQDALRFFEALEELKDNESKTRELTTQFSHLRYFWFAKEFDNLCTGYDVKEADLGMGRVKKFKQLFDQLKTRLQELKLEHFLAETAPARNILLVKQVIELIPPEDS